MTGWLIPLFGLTALLYASVGFAGGSTYTALMVLAGLPFALIPPVSLICNLIVSTGGLLRFARAGHVPWRRAAPILLLSVPAAALGGAVPIDPALFVLLLGLSLCVAGVLLLLGREPASTRAPATQATGPGLFVLLVSLPLGLLSGLVGIGGGIFLAPLLHLFGWDSSRRIAATASLFIFANSLAGLVGQTVKIAQGNNAATDALIAAATGPDAWLWGLLLLAVVVGGQAGSHVGAALLPPAMIRRVTGLVVIIAGVRLLTA